SCAADSPASWVGSSFGLKAPPGPPAGRWPEFSAASWAVVSSASWVGSSLGWNAPGLALGLGLGLAALAIVLVITAAAPITPPTSIDPAAAEATIATRYLFMPRAWTRRLGNRCEFGQKRVGGAVGRAGQAAASSSSR